MRFIKTAIAGTALLASATGAGAHPHVLVDARAEVVFDSSGDISAIRNIWQFDEAFTAFAIQGLDANDDGELSDEELAPLAQVNVDSLKEFDFFTYLTVGNKSVAFSQPTEYFLQFYDGRLTLFYTLPLKTPVAANEKTTLEVFDPEYFVAFTFLEDGPVTLVDAPADCGATYQAPEELDPQMMATLSAIPADQRDLPQALQDAAAGLASLIRISCG